jgi:hypothetical protein
LTAADHFTKAVVLAWEYHPVTGRRINRAILRHLEKVGQLGKMDVAQTICDYILQNGRQRLNGDNPSALQDFESFLERLSLA